MGTMFKRLGAMVDFRANHDLFCWMFIDKPSTLKW
jgi:hypothetical protein